MTTKRSIAIVIRAQTPSDPEGAVLIVQRPPDDEDLPDVWGLPAGSLLDGESWTDAVERAGREKLGVTLETGRMHASGTSERPGYTLSMRLYEARIVAGEPTVPQPAASVTQYQAVRWGDARDLEPAARRGSLCSRLFLHGAHPA